MTAPQAVAFHDVSKRFGDRLVLDGQSATFAAGSVTIIRGRSGSGKSTLLNLIAGYVEPDRGSVDRPDTFGYLVQEELLFSELTVRDNVRLRIEGARGEDGDGVVDEVIAALALESFATTPVSRLSGGERRRVEIASILGATPGVVLLDEPTSGLDPGSREAVYAAAWQAFRGRTLILVTHEEHVPGLDGDVRLLTLKDGQLG